MPAEETRDEALEACRRIIASRRVTERLLHARYYRDEDPGESLMRGLELSAAAIESGTEASS